MPISHQMSLPSYIKTVDEMVKFISGTIRHNMTKPIDGADHYTCKFILFHHSKHLLKILKSKDNKSTRFDLILISEIGKLHQLDENIKAVLEIYKQRG